MSFSETYVIVDDIRSGLFMHGNEKTMKFVIRIFFGRHDFIFASLVEIYASFSASWMLFSLFCNFDYRFHNCWHTSM